MPHLPVKSVALVCKEKDAGWGSVVSCICDFGTARTSRQHQRVLSLVLPSSRRTKITLRAQMRSVLLSKEPPPSAVDGTLSCCTALAPCYFCQAIPPSEYDEKRRERETSNSVLVYREGALARSLAAIHVRYPIYLIGLHYPLRSSWFLRLVTRHAPERHSVIQEPGGAFVQQPPVSWLMFPCSKLACSLADAILPRQSPSAPEGPRQKKPKPFDWMMRLDSLPLPFARG